MKSENRLQASPSLRCRSDFMPCGYDFPTESQTKPTEENADSTDGKLPRNQETCSGKQETEKESASDFSVEFVCISRTVPVKRYGQPVQSRNIKQTC